MTTGSFLWQKLPSNAATTTVNLAGTFSGTLTIRLSNNGGGSWTTNNTTTSAGTTSISTNGFTDICADVTTFTSGSFAVTITTGLNTGPVGPAGPPGSGSGISSVPGNLALLNTTIDAFNRVGALGANWTTYLNGFTLTSGLASATTASQYNLAAYTGVTTVPTQTVKCVVGTLNGTTTDPFCAVRISGTPTTSVNFYACELNTTTLTLVKVTGASNASTGTTTVFGGAGVSVSGAVGQVITLSIVGNTLTCTLNSLTNSLLQAEDTTSPLTTGFPGIGSLSSPAALSTFTLINPTVPGGAVQNIVFDGDSIIAANGQGSTGTDPATSYLFLQKTPVYVTNLGESGKCLGIACNAATVGTMPSMLTTGTSVVDTLCVPGITNIVVIFGGSNDLAQASPRTPAQVNADLTTYVAARHANVGCPWKVVSVPVLSRGCTTAPTIDPNIQVYDALVYANSAGADAVVQLPFSVTGAAASCSTALWNADVIHPLEITHIDVLARAFSATLSKF